MHTNSSQDWMKPAKERRNVFLKFMASSEEAQTHYSEDHNDYLTSVKEGKRKLGWIMNDVESSLQQSSHPSVNNQ